MNVNEDCFYSLDVNGHPGMQDVYIQRFNSTLLVIYKIAIHGVVLKICFNLFQLSTCPRFFVETQILFQNPHGSRPMSLQAAGHGHCWCVWISHLLALKVPKWKNEKVGFSGNGWRPSQLWWVPSWELTYPFPRQFWRWVSSSQGGIC